MDVNDLWWVAKNIVIPALGAIGGFVTASYAVRSDVKELKKSFEELKAGWKLEFTDHKNDLDKDFKELKEKSEKFEEKMHRWERESSVSFASDEELSRFIEDQQRQWQQIQRTLGQIEGMMKKLP